MVPKAYIIWNVLLKNACVCAKSLQPCLALYDPMDCSSPGSSVHGILQAGILGWVAMPSSRGSSRPRETEENQNIPPFVWSLLFSLFCESKEVAEAILEYHPSPLKGL